MKKKCLLLILIFPLFIFSQNIIWEKSYGGTHTDCLFNPPSTVDCDFIWAGSSLANKTRNKRDDSRGGLIVGSGNKRKWNIAGNDLKKEQPL